MQIGKNTLCQPKDTLRLDEIETQWSSYGTKWGCAITAATIWTLVFSIQVGMVVMYDHSWSPLKWLVPIGIAITWASVKVGWRRRKLRIEKEQLRCRVDTFVINDEELNGFKSDLHTLTNKTLAYCDTQDQQHRVLSAYCNAAWELMLLDGSVVDTRQDEALEGFKGLQNTLRIVCDEVVSEREKALM